MPPAAAASARGHVLARATGPLVAVCVAGWALLAWMALDMGTPLARLAMPAAGDWTPANWAAVLAMWAVMMAAMMLPSALPMVLAFVRLHLQRQEPARAGAFTAAYVAVWSAFSVMAGLLQWTLQRWHVVDPMAASTSSWLSATLILLAGAWQFTPLKRACLRQCRTPVGFLLGAWQPGVAGAFRMGVHHGLLCVGCCWALMLLLFVGGSMNLPWVAAVAIAVGVEKLAPRGERLGAAMGGALIGVGAMRMVALAMS